MNTAIPILVVEDSHTVGLVITRHLQNLGFSDIDLAKDGHSALDRARQKHYGLIISDWEMEPIGGEQLIKTLRQDARYAKVPVVLITGTAGRGSSWLAGADAFLSKPFKESDLATAIRRVLGN